MYAAFCPVFWASRKMSPAVVIGVLAAHRHDRRGEAGLGHESVRERLRSSSPTWWRPGDRGPGSLCPATLAGRATENEKLICFAPGAPEAVPAAGERNAAVTETRSPGENGRSGVNAVPWPAGWALRRPACRPLREPTTETLLTCARVTAGKSIFVPGAAAGVPGKGSTSRAGDETERPDPPESPATVAAGDAAPPTTAKAPMAAVSPAVEPGWRTRSLKVRPLLTSYPLGPSTARCG